MQIQDKALLVKLAIGMPGNGRKDKKLTAEVTANHRLQANAGRWNKTLYPVAAFLPLTELAGSARTLHYRDTLPWLDEGFRILPVLMFDEYTKGMRKIRNEFQELSESHFLGQLTKWESEARAMHNGTFNEKDYLPEHKLRKKFKFSTDCIPIPSSADFRVKISSDEMAALQSGMDNRLEQATRDAQADLWRRLVEPLEHLMSKLREPDSTFRDSLIGNLRDICQLIPKLNLTGDRHLADFAEQVERQFSGLQPQRLRDFPSERNAAKMDAESIMAKMADYMPAEAKGEQE